MVKRLLPLILLLATALLVACSEDGSVEPAAAPAESQSASEGAAAGDAETADNAARPKFIEFYADW